MAWDPKIYMSFGAERTRAAAELLARIALDAPSRVADLGCGPGNSTALLAARWPQARVEGVDNSPEMLAEARASGIPAQWREGDVSGWTPDAPQDVIYSNATLHWLPDHAHLLPRLMSHLAPGGWFALQVPRNFSEPCHTLIHDVANAGPWAAKLQNVRDWGYVREPEEYFDILEPVASHIDIWETRYMQVLDGEDAVYRWMSGTGLRPFANALEGEDRENFLYEYKERLRSAYPMRASGKTLYPFQRLFAVARR
ncbi:MAG TPA: trans-aconitate 2-methyltransferase [Rhizomicrobium sp.]|nr:trans-aconitate 2-methyltransferase [Rhizomicrobium sp.]